MTMRKGLIGTLLAVAASALFLQGCSSDSNPAGPGGGTPGTGTKVAAGVYQLSLSQWTCGMMDTMSIVESATFCAEFSLDELFELDCPVVISNGAFTIDCTWTDTENGCTYTRSVQVTGTQNGNTLNLEGTVSISNENPVDCSGEPACAGVRATLEKIAEAPTACAYADANTIQATIGGGPFAGSTTLDAGGFGNDVGGLFSWSIFANASSGFAAKRPADISNLANLSINVSGIDPNALPATFELVVTGGGVAQSALPEGTASYFDQTTEGTYFYSTGGSGSITVNEVSDTHIAGTINSMTIDGEEYTPGGGTPTPSTRTLSGGFFVEETGFPTKSGRGGWLVRRLD